MAQNIADPELAVHPWSTTSSSFKRPNQMLPSSSQPEMPLSPPSYQPPAPNPSESKPKKRKKRGKTVFLLGAPAWDQIEANILSAAETQSSGTNHPGWRVLHNPPKRLITGLTQGVVDPVTALVLTPQDYSYFTCTQESIEHSYSISVSQPAGSSQNEDYEDAETTFLSNADTTTDTSFPNSTQEPERPPLPPLITLTDLEDLPKASDVAAAPTNSLRFTALVAVLSISAPRLVTSKYGRKTQVITLMVGDPTYAPFRIDVWLEVRPKTVDEMELKAVARELRVQDAIVVKNLRLGVWKDVVFGATWGVGSSGGSSLWVVHRVRCEGSEEWRRWRIRWNEAVLAERKVAKTIRWVEAFVGSGPGLGAAGRVHEDNEHMPMDTQAGDFSF